ncbi:MAG: hypothetical protein QM762_16375 [Chryseolinea sp.]
MEFLREKLAEGKIDISFHAIHHRLDDEFKSEMKNNYVRGAEFFTTKDLTAKLTTAIDYLTQLFGGRVTVFTPPQNLLSIQGYRAVINNGLSIVGAGIPFWRKELTGRGLGNFAKLLFYKTFKRKLDYPYVLKFENHAEIIHHYPLHPTTRVGDLINRFNEVERSQRSVCTIEDTTTSLIQNF